MLQLWMFNGKTKASRSGLLRQAAHVLKSGQVEEPVWYKAMREAPPLAEPRSSRPTLIEFPEVCIGTGDLSVMTVIIAPRFSLTAALNLQDKLVAEYLRRIPDARAIPVECVPSRQRIRCFFVSTLVV